eukprot:gene2740-1725_t
MLTTIYTTLQSNKYITVTPIHKNSIKPSNTLKVNNYTNQNNHNSKPRQPPTTISNHSHHYKTHNQSVPTFAVKNYGYTVQSGVPHTQKKQLESNPSTNQQIKATQASPNHKFLNKTPKQVSQKYHNITQPTGAPTFKVKSRLIQSVTNHLHSVPTTNYQHTNPTANSHNHNTHRNNKTHRTDHANHNHNIQQNNQLSNTKQYVYTPERIIHVMHNNPCQFNNLQIKHPTKAKHATIHQSTEEKSTPISSKSCNSKLTHAKTSKGGQEWGTTKPITQIDATQIYQKVKDQCEKFIKCSKSTQNTNIL